MARAVYSLFWRPSPAGYWGPLGRETARQELNSVDNRVVQTIQSLTRREYRAGLAVREMLHSTRLLADAIRGWDGARLNAATALAQDLET